MPTQRLIRAAAIALLAGLLTATLSSADSGEMIRQYQFVEADQGYSLKMVDVEAPSVRAGEVMVRLRATSLNRRDLNLLNGQYPVRSSPVGAVPLSDGAGEVIAIGTGVTRFAVGDRVAGIFFSKWLDGGRTPEGLDSARGAGVGGMLSEVITSNENGLVKIPDHLSYAEAATLPCAAVTAWSGLFKYGKLDAGDFVLLEGTGGVSTFGLLFSVAAGANPIITSSSNSKLAKASTLGAAGTVNYRENENWQLNVRELTGGRGVDHVLEIGGRDTLGKALKALGFDSHIALIGGMTGFDAVIPVGALMRIGGRATGVYVGSRADFEAMNAFITEHQIRPVIDRVFAFEDAPQAFEHMRSGSFMGKIVIKL